MTLAFTKMHGLGNDFMIIDATQIPFTGSAAKIQAWSQRKTGVGFDQCLIIENSGDPNIDFFYRIFNADGQEVGQCGNGARCLARFVYDQGLTAKKQITVNTKTTTLNLTLHEDHTVTVDFGKPEFDPKRIPILAPYQDDIYTLSTAEGNFRFHAINVGNPHIILKVDDLDNVDVETIGRTLSTHPFFPDQINVNFLQILSPKQIRLRVYERGCGETQACGSGAVATMAVGKLYHHLDPQVQVNLPGGALMVSWDDISSSIFLRGPATYVYAGQLLERD